MPQPDPADLADLTTGPQEGTYFIYGKHHIKITEHFAPNGKLLNELLEEAVYREAKEKVIKIA